MDFSEIDPAVWVGLASVSIVALAIIWKIAKWKGELDRWKREVNEWRDNASVVGADPPHSAVGNQTPVERAAPSEGVPDRSDSPVTPTPKTEMALLYALTDRGGEACTLADIENDTATFHHDLGNLLYRSRQFEEAEKEYREALRLEPDSARAHANLGFLLKRMKRHEEFVQEFEMALASKEQLPDKGERIMKILQEIKET